MQTIAAASDRKDHFKSHLTDGLVFNANVSEISILDRWGRIVWKKARGASLEPIHWNGLDFFGEPVRGGSYLFKFIYPDTLVVYVPFVFIQHSSHIPTLNDSPLSS